MNIFLLLLLFIIVFLLIWLLFMITLMLILLLFKMFYPCFSTGITLFYYFIKCMYLNEQVLLLRLTTFQDFESISLRPKSMILKVCVCSCNISFVVRPSFRLESYSLDFIPEEFIYLFIYLILLPVLFTSMSEFLWKLSEIEFSTFPCLFPSIHCFLNYKCSVVEQAKMRKEKYLLIFQ